MSDMGLPIPRGRMTAPERHLRSELNRLLCQYGLLHGTLVRRQRKCGRPACRCAQGPGHPGLYLVVTERGRTRQLYVPQRWARLVEQWIAAYQRSRALLDELSRLHWAKVQRRGGG